MRQSRVYSTSPTNGRRPARPSASSEQNVNVGCLLPDHTLLPSPHPDPPSNGGRFFAALSFSCSACKSSCVQTPVRTPCLALCFIRMCVSQLLSTECFTSHRMSVVSHCFFLFSLLHDGASLSNNGGNEATALSVHRLFTHTALTQYHGEFVCLFVRRPWRTNLWDVM